jgi:hypothetical protein
MIHHSHIRASSGTMLNSRYLGPMDWEYGKQAGHSVCEKWSRRDRVPEDLLISNGSLVGEQLKTILQCLDVDEEKAVEQTDQSSGLFDQLCTNAAARCFSSSINVHPWTISPEPFFHTAFLLILPPIAMLFAISVISPGSPVSLQVRKPG